MTKFCSLIVFATVLVTTASAQQNKIENYRDAKNTFWSEIYNGPGWTLYCSEYFSGGKVTRNSDGFEIDHIYPNDWMKKKFGCNTVDQCRRESAEFNFASADLHNLYPVLKLFNNRRDRSLYGEIDGEER